jgi:hypothetical protein
MAEVMTAADGEARQARELMILLHTGLFVIQRDETSTAEELREFAGQILDRTRITKQEQPKYSCEFSVLLRDGKLALTQFHYRGKFMGSRWPPFGPGKGNVSLPLDT